jgi:copper/silver efflux system protein
VMYWLGIDSNIMSLAGLAIAIGDVADMGVIMTENIYRHVSQNDGSKTHFQCVQEGAHEVGGAILTAVSNTIVSFIPVFALADQEGKLFHPLAYTKTFAITASVALALTVVPVLSLHLLNPKALSRKTSTLIAALVGLVGAGLAAFVVRPLLGTSDTMAGRGWILSATIGFGLALVVYRMARERLVSLEENFVSRLILRIYVPCLRWVLSHKALFLSLPITASLLGLLIWLGFGGLMLPVERMLARANVDLNQSATWSGLKRQFPGLGREFMPALDEGSLLYMPSLLPAGSLSAALEVIATQDRAIATVPEVDNCVGKIGRADSALDPAPIGMIETVILLKPQSQWRTVREERFYANWPDWTKPGLRWFWPEERTITRQEILDELKSKTAIPGVLPSWLQPIQTRLIMLQSGFRAMMGVKIFGADLKQIEKLGVELEPILRTVPGAADVIAERITGKPYIEFAIDREKIARFGVNIRDVQDVIEVAIGGENLTTSVEGRERYPIRVRYPRELRDNLEDLQRILVPANNGAHIPITQVAEIRYSIGPQEIKSENALLVGYVTLNARGRDEISVVEEAEALIQSRIASGDIKFPPGYYYKWAGQFENQVRAMKRLAILLPACLCAQFVLLYLGLGRWWLALVVFSDVLVSASGGFIMLALWEVNMSVAVWVGFIALFGVAEDDSVLTATYLTQLFNARTPTTKEEVRDMVVEAGKKRIRPGLMTTATTVIGLMPVFLAHGRGSDVMQPMAIPSMGGMMMSALTMFIAPCIYCIVEERKLARRMARTATPRQEP